ncbi:autotransporter outer membrane beta-barrel domain-containing protein [Candidatus Poribacteria bacterium]|nr:autotransporter outer membrane beta-barrel domain-containing protein [Candidatus Poribacteria bacterium]
MNKIKTIQKIYNYDTVSHYHKPSMKVFLSSLILMLICVTSAIAAENPFSVSGYGVINYAHFNWELDPDRRAVVDLERLVIAPKYRINNTIHIEAEIEFEHGGTGSTMEFDKFEEFGEFELEIEKGGEIIVEKLAAVFSIKPHLNFRIGHIIVPVGLVSKHHRPQHYFTTTRPESESHIIPTIWHETGVEAFGTFGALSYQAQIVNGLDSTGFSSRHWIVPGQQLRFETVNAEAPALVGRLDYNLQKNFLIGISGYYGDTAANRPKPDVDFDAYVGIASIHGLYELNGVKVRGLFIMGTLENAHLLSKVNRTLSNNLNVKRTPIGSSAIGWYIEAGYDVLSLLMKIKEINQKLDIFGRYDYYDTMASVEGIIFDNPRWERTTWTIGLNYHVHPQLVFKSHYSLRKLATKEKNKEDTFSLGVGFQY